MRGPGIARSVAGDLVLVHCNSMVDGFWTDVTRTFCLGEPDERQHAMYEAIFAARQRGTGSHSTGSEGMRGRRRGA